MSDAAIPGPSGPQTEPELLAQVRHRLDEVGAAPRVEGFVAWPGPLADAALHALLIGLSGLFWAELPQLGVLAVGLVVLASLAQRRGHRVLRHLLPRRRSYNIVGRVGEGPRKVVAFAFVDGSASTGAVATAVRMAVWAAAGVSSACLLLAWAGVEAGPVHSVLRVLSWALAGLGGLGIAAALRLRSPIDARPVEQLLSLAERPPAGVELYLVACGAGWPHLDGLRALEEQHRHEWGGDTRWLYLGGSAPARGWLARQRLATLDAGSTAQLLGPEYDAFDADVAFEHSAGRDAVRGGDGT
ncbi:MAG: hypothetical protein GY913_18005 [Proteobacteria bacterium]|nr:hypothetical protein [Pseudomonadota bacterium]MCP4918802.1 hypothetical protein [Pseudomonadota bacterium]